MRDLAAQDHLRVERMIGVYMGERHYQFDTVDVLPLPEFLRQGHAGQVF